MVKVCHRRTPLLKIKFLSGIDITSGDISYNDNTIVKWNLKHDMHHWKVFIIKLLGYFVAEILVFDDHLGITRISILNVIGYDIEQADILKFLLLKGTRSSKITFTR